MSPHAVGRRHVHRTVAAGVPLAMLAALVAVGTANAQGYPAQPRVTRTATLGDIPLGTFSNALLPGTVGDDRGVDLGGIGSDIYPAGAPGRILDGHRPRPQWADQNRRQEAPHVPGARLRPGDREDQGVR
ncbi:hypothetical protein SAMN02787118_101221 [Streptomyces mirabilis]|uniref:Uncharacterized protein n=1 Tax=Streptomyces mirabilis TaxID=68239 RepID=A0A1I1ZCA3_9ACTN|nr:hypothetical protein SAMN02787118_101221 [Streptomyces mirabilis]